MINFLIIILCVNFLIYFHIFILSIFGILFMSNFNLNPLSAALIGAIATITGFTHAETDNAQVQQMETIVVSAAGFEQKIKNAPASISVVTKEDIEKKNATSIADLFADFLLLTRHLSLAFLNCFLRVTNSSVTA